VTRPRAADDFVTIRERIKELRREAIQANSGENRRPCGAETLLTDHEKRHNEPREGLPPPWVPTIFLAASDEGVVGNARRSRAQIRWGYALPMLAASAVAVSRRVEYRPALLRMEFFGQTNKGRKEGAHIGDGDHRAPCPAAAISVPDAERPDVTCGSGEKFYIAVRDGISHYSNEVAHRFGITICWPFFCDIWPPDCSSVGKRSIAELALIYLPRMRKRTEKRVK
jgi:hypothetical protein